MAIFKVVKSIFSNTEVYFRYRFEQEYPSKSLLNILILYEIEVTLQPGLRQSIRSCFIALLNFKSTDKYTHQPVHKYILVKVSTHIL